MYLLEQMTALKPEPGTTNVFNVQELVGHGQFMHALNCLRDPQFRSLPKQVGRRVHRCTC